MNKANTSGHTISRDQAYLNTQISNYIKHAPLRRLKRSGSLGLSENSVRNLKRFYVLIKEFEGQINKTIMLKEIDHMLVHTFKEWLLTEKAYSLNNAGLQLKLLKMICKEAERMSIPVNPYTRHIESFTQKLHLNIRYFLCYLTLKVNKNKGYKR